MVDAPKKRVAIVDYGFGNLFSVRQACESVGLEANIISLAKDVIEADAVILPGVGAFGDAMESIVRLDLVSPLLEVAASKKPLIGICLGMQLLFTESFEFGRHRGLGLIDGQVLSLVDRISETRKEIRGTKPVHAVKIPHVGWTRLHKHSVDSASLQQGHSTSDPWSSSPLEGVEDGAYMYFIHSYYLEPEDKDVVLSWSIYGDMEFCSSVRFDNIHAYQFHPERSGPQGLQIYGNLANLWQSETPSENTLNA